MKDTYRTGLSGESEAERFLREEKHMACLERRYRTKHAEIDLIMLDGETVVFVEVKARTRGVPGSGLLAITQTKQKKITQAAVIYLMQHRQMHRPVLFDAVEIVDGKLAYIRNAFQPGGMFY